MITDITQEVSNQLAQAMARKTDDVYSEAITRFLGSEAWTIESLKGRCVLQRMKNGVETLIVDGVAIVEMLPIEIEKTGTRIFASRAHRFLIPKHGEYDANH